MAQKLTFTAIGARQSEHHRVFTFAAQASEILAFATIERAARDDAGTLSGFQRPQIAEHIREIRRYLERDEAVLPNPIVVAFVGGVEVQRRGAGLWDLEIDISNGPPGVVVDGQQRLSALSGVSGKSFEAFVAALICQDHDELRRQFVLINNTRPLPRALIYELLPTVSGLPTRLAVRSRAAALAERLNYDPASSLKGEIRQHTNPAGKIIDTALQKVVMNSAANGALRDILADPTGGGDEACFRLVSDFYAAVRATFPGAWTGHTPKTSRLVHGAGIVALGYVMDLICTLEQTPGYTGFVERLAPLADRCAWTGGHWQFSDRDVRPWNGIQNINRDILLLAEHLVRIVKLANRLPLALAANA